MKLIIVMAAVLTSALLTVPTVSAAASAAESRAITSAHSEAPDVLA